MPHTVPARPAPLDSRRVFAARASGPGYADADAAVASVLRAAGLDAEHVDAPDWNPLGDLIPRGGRVLVKPNWVYHHNRGEGGLDALITHAAVIEAITRHVLRARPAEIVIGDAPVQGCDFAALCADGGITAMLARLQPEAERLGVGMRLADFRRVVLPGGAIEHRRTELQRDDSDYVLFDLAADSALEAVTTPHANFRVTMYDPAALARTHGPGRHQYLVAREAIDADVVISVPKLKTHRKSGITGALKNLVGINGHKEYLPHHRKGGDGVGDCYPGRSRVKAIVEDLLDVANASRTRWLRWLLPRISVATLRAGVLRGEDGNIEGSWHGNDTVWRMCLDLQRLLRYGRADGTLAASPQRLVLTLTDAIVAGEGEGPLLPSPAPLGLVTFGTAPAALEWVHALLMGFDPARVPLVRNAFGRHRYALADFGPEEITVATEDGEFSPEAYADLAGRDFRPPAGWVGHCERPRASGVGAVAER